jgi:hypothetical protein
VIRSAVSGLVVLCALVPLLSACESTQDKSKRLAKEGAKASAKQKGIVVTRQSAEVAVGRTFVVSNENGSAAVVELQNKTSKAFAKVPLSITIPGTAGKKLYGNDSPGLQDSLTGPASLGPKEKVVWVNDQVGSLEKPGPLKAIAGDGKPSPAAALPKIVVGPPKITVDEVSGIEAVGKVTNRSAVLQRMLFIYAVAIKGDKVVAAGRGAIEALKPGKTKKYSIFFIGNPRGARIELSAPPTVLK